MRAGIRLHVVEKEDLAFIHKLTNDADIMSYWFEEPYQSISHLEQIYEESLKNKQTRLFILKNKEERIGFIGIFSIDWIHRKAEFGIMIDPKHQGNGYASTGTELAMNYVFSTLNLHKLYLIVDETNEKAIHIYKKAGFQAEGRLRDEFFINGTYHHIIIMSIFQPDYFLQQQ